MSRSIVAANIVERDADKYHLCERSMRTILHVHGAWKPARRGVEEIYEMECVCVYRPERRLFPRRMATTMIRVRNSWALRVRALVRSHLSRMLCSGHPGKFFSSRTSFSMG